MDNSLPFLSPIEKPNSLMMRLIYYFTRKQLGKVVTPVKVFSARMPVAFGLFGSKIYQLDKKLVLSSEFILLIRQKVAQINICEFCMDASRSKAIQESMNEAKFDALSQYQTSPLFSEAEKAALDYVSEVVTHKHVNPATFKKLASYYSEREICDMVYLMATEHVSNITNISLNIHSDMLCDITKGKPMYAT